MNYALIRNNVCYNIVVFDSDEDVDNFKVFSPEDEIIKQPIDFGIGDSYINGVWTKQSIPEPVQPAPSEDERISALERSINLLLGM